MLLTAAAGYQWTQVASHDQSSWSGIGFGMFATFEEETNRRVVVTIRTASGNAVAETPEDLRDDLERLRVRPSADETERLARTLGELRWSFRNGRAVVDADGNVAFVTVSVEGVRVTGGPRPSAQLFELRKAQWPRQ